MPVDLMTDCMDKLDRYIVISTTEFRNVDFKRHVKPLQQVLVFKKLAWTHLCQHARKLC